LKLLDYKKTSFLKSYVNISDIDIQYGIEIAFIGYSNSGKSTVINTLTKQKKISRSSKTPGRTQLINFFEIVPNFRIVDLPGYGYANAPLLIREKWQKNTYDYLKKRNQIKGFVFLMDIRYPFKKLDYIIIDIAKKRNTSILVLLNKCDKLKKYQQKIQFNKAFKELQFLLNSFEIELFSSFKKIGIKKLKFQLNNWYNQYTILNN